MADDLVTALRDEQSGGNALDGMAADRIEKLEAEVEEWKQRCLSSVLTLLAEPALHERERPKADFEKILGGTSA